MRKKISFILVLAVLMSLVVLPVFADTVKPASAYDPQPTKTSTNSGFYDLTKAANVEVVIGSEFGEVTEESVDVDDDLDFETLYANSDQLTVTYSGATVGKLYNIYLLKGTDNLGEMSESNLYFVRESDPAASTSVEWLVRPLWPILEDAHFYLIITSDDGKPAVKSDIYYAYCNTGADEEHWVEPTGGAVLKGDVNNDGNVNSDDLIVLARHVAGIEEITDAACLEAADVDGVVGINSDDLIMLARYVAGIIDSFD